MNNALILIQSLKSKLCDLFKNLQDKEEMTNYDIQAIYYDIFESLTIIESEIKRKK